jgi:hypothetical protein
MNYFQTFLIGILLIHVTEDPSLRYSIAVAVVFIAFGGLTFLIFLPKVIAVEFGGGSHITISSGPKATTFPDINTSGNVEVQEVNSVFRPNEMATAGSSAPMEH